MTTPNSFCGKCGFPVASTLDEICPNCEASYAIAVPGVLGEQEAPESESTSTFSEGNSDGAASSYDAPPPRNPASPTGSEPSFWKKYGWWVAAVTVVVVIILANFPDFGIGQPSSSEIFERYSPAVVEVITDEGTGTGLVLEGGHTVITAAHVLPRDTGSFVVEALDGSRNGKLLAIDRDADIAFLYLNRPFKLKEYPRFAESIPLIGTETLVLGYPEGLGLTLTKGTLSARLSAAGFDHIQTDAPANPGSSGGPVFSADGEVVGIIVLGLEDAEGLNFAISSLEIRELLPSSYQKATRATPTPTARPTATPVPRVKIGLLIPETGPIAQYAPGFDSGGKVALAELNETHEGDFEFELIVGDSACDATTAATAAQALIDRGVSVIVGAACSGASLAAMRVAAPAGVPMISYASTSPALTTADDDGYFFRIVPSDAQQAVALTAVASAAGVSKPAVLYMTNDYGAGLGDNFIANWSGAVCKKAAYDPAEGKYDAAALAQFVVSGGCDSVLLMSYSTDGASIIEALSAQGFKGTVIGADGIGDANFTRDFTDASAVDGVVATRPRPGRASVATSAFERAYAAARGDAGGIYTHETYDAIKIAAAAIISDPDGDIKAAVAKTGVNYDGASGSHTFDANGDVLGTGFEVCQFTGTNFSCPWVWTADGGLASK